MHFIEFVSGRGFRADEGKLRRSGGSFRGCFRGGILLLILALCAALPARVPTLNQRITCESLRIPLPKDASKEAPAAVETFTYTWTRGNKSGTDERFDPRQLWEAEQRLGKWTDGAGNTYELVQPQSVIESFDKGFEGKYAQLMPHVLKEEYALNRKKVGKLSRKELPQWLDDWTGKAFGAPQRLKPMGAVAQAMFATSDGMAALIFYLKAAPNRPYVLLVTTPNEAPNAWKMPLSRALSGIAPAGKQRLPAAEETGGWTTIEKPPYRVLSNLPKQYAKFLNTLLLNMQQMRKTYAAYIPEPKNQKVPVSVIRVFATPEEYHAYAGAGEEWSSGVFSSTHRELVVMGDVENDSMKSQKEDIRKVTFHEGFHQYLFSISPPATRLPLWFNEGHATFFETFKLTSKGPKPELSYRLEEVRRDPRFCSPEGLALLMRFDHEIFYHEKNRTAAYASSWLLVHWLRTEAPKALEATLNQYYQLICKGKSLEEAQEKLYPPEVLQQISEGLIDFLNRQEYRP